MGGEVRLSTSASSSPIAAVITALRFPNISTHMIMAVIRARILYRFPLHYVALANH